MSEVKRYPADEQYPGQYSARCDLVPASAYDAAQSQLAALREERDRLDASLSCLNGHVLAYKLSRQRLLARARARELLISEMQQRLADAERRNAELVELLRDTAKVLRGGECYGWEDNQADIIDAALNPKPEAASHDE